MTRKRSREEMAEQILREARSPEATVTGIMQVVSLEWNSWKALKAKLLKGGLLVVVDGHLRTTDKGIAYLAARERLRSLMVV
jgi:predicted transcriptional regulator